MTRILLVFAMICSSLFPTQALELPKNEEPTWHDISELEHMSIEDTLTYEEVLDVYMNMGLSEEEALKAIGPKPKNTRANTVVYYSLMKMETFDYYVGNNHYQLQARFTVGMEYYQGCVEPERIVSLEGGHIYTGGGNNCGFQGTLFYKLSSGNSFYYNFYGDIFDRSPVSPEIGGAAGIGDSLYVYFKVTASGAPVKNVSESGSFYSSGLKP